MRPQSEGGKRVATRARPADARAGTLHPRLGTSNPLADSEGGYENVTVAQSLDVPDADLLLSVPRIPAGSKPGDFIDGLVVALAMLHEHTSGKKVSRRVVLITDAGSEVNDVSHIDNIVQTLGQMECTLQILCVARVVWGRGEGRAGLTAPPPLADPPSHLPT